MHALLRYQKAKKQNLIQVNLLRFCLLPFGTARSVKQVMGIEPTSPAWKAGVLPLNHTCILYAELTDVCHTIKNPAHCQGVQYVFSIRFLFVIVTKYRPPVFVRYRHYHSMSVGIIERIAYDLLLVPCVVDHNIASVVIHGK